MKSKLLPAGIISGLTLTSLWGCKLQYQKYRISQQKWGKIYSNIEQEAPLPLDKTRISHLQLENKSQWEFDYVETKGQFLEQTFYVYRSKFNRQGYFVIRPFKVKDSEETIFVNVGWIPFDQKGKISLPTQENIEGMLHVSEDSKILESQRKMMDSHKEFLYINLEEFSKRSGIRDANKDFYLEQLKNQSSQIYPYQHTKSNFERPYLTPRRHLEYSTFWGACSIFGIWSLSQILRVKK